MVPAGHSVQLEAPAADAKEPAAQGVQEARPVAPPNLPAAHSAQVEMEAAPTAAEEEPEEQLTQANEPSILL